MDCCRIVCGKCVKIIIWENWIEKSDIFDCWDPTVRRRREACHPIHVYLLSRSVLFLQFL